MPKKNNLPKRLAQTVTVDVSAEEYQADLAKRLQPDETLQPGRHVFRRGGFLQRHAQAQAGQEIGPNKVRISINLDSAISTKWFKLSSWLMRASCCSTGCSDSSAGENAAGEYAESSPAGF